MASRRLAAHRGTLGRTRMWIRRASGTERKSNWKSGCSTPRARTGPNASVEARFDPRSPAETRRCRSISRNAGFALRPDHRTTACQLSAGRTYTGRDPLSRRRLLGLQKRGIQVRDRALPLLSGVDGSTVASSPTWPNTSEAPRRPRFEWRNGTYRRLLTARSGSPSSCIETERRVSDARHDCSGLIEDRYPLGCREVARTNERTHRCIGSVIPSDLPAGHSVPIS